MQRLVWCVCLLCMCGIARGQTDYEGVYWFDNNEDFAAELYGNGTFDIDVSSLSNGLHAIHYMVSSANDVQSAPQTKLFMKIPQMADKGSVICRCIIDGEPYHTEEVSAVEGIINWAFDVSKLSQGVHSIQVQVELPSGEITALQHGMFIRTATSEELASMKCYYLIDDSDSYVEAGRYDGGLFHFDLDVSALDNGLHQISYMLVGDNGVATKMCSALFTKIPVGGNGLTKYEYWLNDNDAGKCVVEFEQHLPFYQLITLLPVESVPIRSSFFHFEVDEEKGPMVYAKNEFHIRFYDAAGLFVDATKEYLDYNVSGKVIGAEEIKKSQSFERPAENCIKWFTLQACEGDTIAFRSSQALSLQVFSPSGKELYAASGAESVKWGGCHTWEDGTHYVAVHDVTGSQPNVILDYLHMDKYDVVDQDVRVVGNGGFSTITFYGNGFRDLYAVDLVSANGDVLDSKAIYHESDATVNITFDFTDKTIGKYDAVFHFTTEDKKFTDVLTLEEAKDITLDIDVQYPSTFLRGTYTTYSIEVKNNGNSTAYYVPLEFQIITEPGVRNAISSVKLKGKVPEMDLDWVDDIVMNPDSARCFKEYVRNKGDMQYFIPFVDSISNEEVLDAFFTVSIPPSSVYKLDVSVLSTSSVNLKALIPIDWYTITGDIDYRARAKTKGSFKERACCVREKVECFINVAVAALDFISLINKDLVIADCAANVGNEYLQFAYDVWCGESNGKTPSEAARDLRMTCVNTLIGCIAAKVGGNFANLQGVYQHIYNNISVLMDCSHALTQKIPNCPPNPGLGGGTSSPVNSYDPNAIYGYMSPSSSKYIAKDSVETVNYRIEFENDTAFATSSAHVVEIRDTLDARSFELDTFAPTYISIGEKREQLDGTPNFVRTVDMRPQINAVVQVEGQYDEQTGIARWLFTSLDPMTMEPTDDVMQGFLPVNHDGTSGIGDVAYRIGLKKGLDDGTVITNRASIVFDSNEPILTPTWTNIVDGSAPISEFLSVEELNDTVIRLKWKGNDGESPAWRYSLAVQAVEDTEWFEFLTNTTDTVLDYRYYRDIDYGFCVLATDSAGNVESTEWVRKAEFMREYIAGDADKNGAVNLLDLNLTLSHILGNEVSGCDMLQMDANGDGSINVLDINAILQIILDADGEGAAQRKRDNGVIRIINTKVI